MDFSPLIAFPSLNSALFSLYSSFITCISSDKNVYKLLLESCTSNDITYSNKNFMDIIQFKHSFIFNIFFLLGNLFQPMKIDAVLSTDFIDFMSLFFNNYNSLKTYFQFNTREVIRKIILDCHLSKMQRKENIFRDFKILNTIKISSFIPPNF